MTSDSQPEPPRDAASDSQLPNVLETPAKPSKKRPRPHILDVGVTELWCPPAPTEILADICFVHGLMGHPFKTWYDERGPGTEEATAGSTTKKWKSVFRSSRIKGKQKIAADVDVDVSQNEPRKYTGFYWPFDCVPDDFPNVRVLTYGYDSHPSHFYVGKTNKMTITQHTQTLLQKLTNNRVDCLTRPIIFVAHSLGGILVKDAIIQSGKYENQHPSKHLSQSCSAIFFFGTPHRGSSAAGYGKILSSVVGALPGGPSVYKELLRSLQFEGEKLSQVEADFNQLLNQNLPADEKIQLYSFQEGKPLTPVNLFDGKVVPDFSSFFNRRDIEQCSHVNENHMDMARFRSPSSSTYADFSAAFKGFLARIQARKDVKLSAVQEAERARLATQQKVLMQIIDFKERCVRQQQLSSTETIQKTFDWIWTSTFKNWLEDDTPFFWISGKPASGKSTLMNYIAHAEETRTTLQDAHNKAWKVIYFFFDFRARDGIGNNMEGFVRCLLFQLCQVLPNLAESVPELRQFIYRSAQKHSQIAPETHIPLGSLRKALLQGLQNCSENILILVDGLDEYEGQKVELTNFIKALHRENIKICTASRPDPPFPDAFGNMPTIRMQELNFDAITSFCLDVLEQFYSSQQHQLTALQTLADEVAQRSLGVFLWARFAVYELIEGLSSGESLESPALEKRLQAVPEELEQIYSRIFHRYAPARRKSAALLLLLICHTIEGITTDTLAKALCFVPSAWTAATNDRTSCCPESDGKSFPRWLFALTGGIVEILQAEGKFTNQDFDCTVPRLIHRTVNTFLESDGWRLLLRDEFTPELGNKIWIQICGEAITRHGPDLALRFPEGPDRRDGYYDTVLKIKQRAETLEDESNGAASASEIPSEVPDSETLLLSYATRNIFIHARGYEDLSAISSRMLLSPAFTAAFMNAHLKTNKYMCSCQRIAPLAESYEVQAQPISYASLHWLTLYVDEALLEDLQQQQQFRPGAGRKMLAKVFGLPDRDKSSGTSSPFAKRVSFLRFLGLICNGEDEDVDDVTVAKMEVFLKYSPTIEDHELFYAICCCSARVVSWLLSQRKSLHIENLNSRYLAKTLGLGNEEYFTGKSLTLMAGLGLRAQLYNTSRVNSVLHLLQERGLKINEECGPLGGVLHYALLESAFWDGFSGALQVLVEHGANVNMDGLRGKPLELLWQIVNARPDPYSSLSLKSVRRAIEILLDHGAINERKDPNGLVPSKIQMRLFGCNRTDYLECKRYYQEGPRDESLVWPGPVPLSPEDMKYSLPRYDIPHKEAMKRYREAMGIAPPSGEDEEATGASSDEDDDLAEFYSDKESR